MILNLFNQLGLMGVPLAICSIVTLAIILERLIFFIKNTFSKDKQYEKLKNDIQNYKNNTKNLRDEVISFSLCELKVPYYKGINALKIIGAIAPIMGLLGTVLGIISSFKVIASYTVAISPSMVADGLWEAMLTTAFGLFISLIALLMAYFFKYLSDNIFNKFQFKLNKISIQYSLETDKA